MAEDDELFLSQLQNYQQQLQTIIIQKENTRLQMLETGKALEELKSVGEGKAYKISGTIMIKKEIEELEKEIEEKMEELEIRSKTLESAEDKITNKLKEMEPRLRKMMEK